MTNVNRSFRSLIFTMSLAYSLLMCTAPNSFAQRYKVADLGTLPGGTWSTGYAINTSGQVSGYSEINADHPAAPFFYSPATGMIAIPEPAAGPGYGINDSGQVTGGKWETTPYHAFLYSAETGVQDLGTLPGGSQSVGYAINASAQVTGQSDTGDHPGEGMLYSAATGMQPIPGLGISSRGNGINDSGQVTGAFGLYIDHAFLYSPEAGVQDLGTLPGHIVSEAYGINASGQVTGVSGSNYFAECDYWVLRHCMEGHAFLYTPGAGMAELGTLPGGSISGGYSINASGRVTGYSTTSGGAFHAFLYIPGKGMKDLNDLIPSGSGWELVCGNAINDAGQITGFGYINGNRRAFLLTPKTAAEMIADLITLVSSFNLKQGIENSMDAKLANAEGALIEAKGGSLSGVCSLMSAFINETQAQSGKALTSDQAAQLISAAEEIRSVLACS